MSHRYRPPAPGSPHAQRRARRGRGRAATALLCALTGTGLLGGLFPASGAVPRVPGPPSASVAFPATADCPEELRGRALCYAGRDANGAYYSIALPNDWNGDLVMHAHGGPGLDPPSPDRSADDLARWSVMVKEGYAWAGTSYRRGGYGVRMAVADTENLRRLFVEVFGQPGRTLLHGQSWGGNVAAKLAENAEELAPGTDGRGSAYDGVLLTNGVLAGGSRGYDHRVDLRVVYQYYCGNHPRPSEEQYPLWQGLPADSEMTTDDLKARIQECTGYQSAPADRTAAQQRNLSDILSVVRIPEETLYSHLKFATFTFRDLVHHRLGGRNPFGNRGVHYTGSHDDRALNEGVQRFAADPSAARDLSYDSDVTGKVSLPVLTLHAIDDPTAFVEHEAAYRASLEGADDAENLVQTFTTEAEHSVLSASEYAAALRSLAGWVATGRTPAPSDVAAACPAADRRYGEGCFFDPDFRPDDYASRVYPRPGGRSWPAMTAAQEEAWSRHEDVGIEP